MNIKEFEKMILKEASKYFEIEDNEAIKESNNKQSENKEILPEDINSLVTEMKKINKKIDLRNPLINQKFFEKTKKNYLNEDTSTRWKKLYNYNIPDDEKRKQ